MLCVAYLFIAIILLFFTFYRRKHFLSQLLPQVFTDIIFLSFLYFFSGGMKSGLAILYLLPLASAAILAHRTIALSLASAVSILLLSEALYYFFSGTHPVTSTQAGLYGAAFLSSSFLLSHLSARLIAQETLATKRGEDLHILQAINHVVISDMDDGFIVVTRDLLLFAYNPAAVLSLGLAKQIPPSKFYFSDFPALKPIEAAFTTWLSNNESPESATDSNTAYVMIKPTVPMRKKDSLQPELHLGTHLHLRFTPVASDYQTEYFVIFLRDVARIENQAQNLKLASMGRLTASIAHEVRNPLAAISHAASLLNEETLEYTQQRLLNIVEENVSRMDRMIDDILNLSRKVKPVEAIPLFDAVNDAVNIASQIPNHPDGLIQFSEVENENIRFDPLHLNEVLINLLSNASRYASGRKGSIRIHTRAPSSGQLELHIQDDGPTISAEVRAHLFEPFYTTSRKGTGLGLYLARELCLNNGAMLDYEFHPDDFSEDAISGRFVISLPLSTESHLVH